MKEFDYDFSAKVRQKCAGLLTSDEEAEVDEELNRQNLAERLDNQIQYAKQLVQDYPGKTIENIVQQLESRLKEVNKNNDQRLN